MAKDTFKIPSEKTREVGQKVKDSFGKAMDFTMELKSKFKGGNK
jgi:hypothetical protein